MTEPAAIRTVIHSTRTFVHGDEVLVILDRRGHDCESLRSRRVRVRLRTRLYELTGCIVDDATIAGLCDVLEGLTLAQEAA